MIKFSRVNDSKSNARTDPTGFSFDSPSLVAYRAQRILQIFSESTSAFLSWSDIWLSNLGDVSRPLRVRRGSPLAALRFPQSPSAQGRQWTPSFFRGYFFKTLGKGYRRCRSRYRLVRRCYDHHSIILCTSIRTFLPISPRFFITASHLYTALDLLRPIP